MWIKLFVVAVCLCTMLSTISGCGKDERAMGEEFTLHISETANIKGENLRIEFLEISEDSRCPRNVVCVWEGRVIAVIEVLKGETSRDVELVEPGLTDTPAKTQFEEYEFAFRILPYPEDAEEPISPEDYRLMLTVNKK